MKSIAIRELLLPFIRKCAEPETLAPFFCNALYQALYRSRVPTGLSTKVVDAAFERCVYLEDLFRKCSLPSPESWAKDPLHPRVVRIASALRSEERAELGSLLLCYLHGTPMAAISLWWQEKADFEVCLILERFLGANTDAHETENREASNVHRAFPEHAKLESRVLLLASSEENEGKGNPQNRVLRFSKGRFGKRNMQMVNESEHQQNKLLAK